MPYADPEKRRAYWRAYHATRPEKHAAQQRTYRATPKGQEAEARYESTHGSDRMIRRIRLEGRRALDPFTV
jgi:hypothetical protein